MQGLWKLEIRIDCRFGGGYIGVTGGGSGSRQHCRSALYPQTKHPGVKGPQRTAYHQPRSHYCEPLIYFKFTSDGKAVICYQENKSLKRESLFVLEDVRCR